MKLIDFLVAPHATTTVLLAEKEVPSLYLNQFGLLFCISFMFSSLSSISPVRCRSERGG